MKNAAPTYFEVWKTANFYHFVHSGLMVVNAMQFSGQKRRVVGWLLSAGIVLFSGSCYVVGMQQDRAYGKLAPVGGMCFIGAWLAVGFL